MYRISNRVMYDNLLYNSETVLNKISHLNEQIVSGKKVNRPSDDPIAILEILNIKTSILKDEADIKRAKELENILNIQDEKLGLIHDSIKEAKALAIQAANATENENTRKIIATRIDQIIEEVKDIGNSRYLNRYLFSGIEDDRQAIDSNGEYSAGRRDPLYYLGHDITIEMEGRADRFLVSDLRPRLSASTMLTALNEGAGISAGNFIITDREGNSATIDTTSMLTVGDLISSINGIGSLNITASISNDTILLQDSSVDIVSPIKITEGSSNTASDLGLLGARDLSEYRSSELYPVLVSESKIADLYSGSQISLDDFKVTQGDKEVIVTFTGSEDDISDITSRINTVLASAAINATASISTDGNRLVIERSSLSDPVVIANSISDKDTPSVLGISGRANLIPTLEKLSDAMKSNDLVGIRNSISSIDDSLYSVSYIRGRIGSSSAYLNSIGKSISVSKDSNILSLADIESADLEKVITDYKLLNIGYESLLRTSSLILDKSLIDFIA